MCEMNDVVAHADKYECMTCGHEWPLEAAAEAPDAERVVKDAYGNVLADGDVVAMIKDLKLGGTSTGAQGRCQVQAHPSRRWRS